MHIIQKVSFMPERNDYMVQRPAPSLLFNSHGNSNGNQFLNHTKNSNIKDLNGYTDRLIGKEFNTSTHDQRYEVCCGVLLLIPIVLLQPTVKRPH